MFANAARAVTEALAHRPLSEFGQNDLRIAYNSLSAAQGYFLLFSDCPSLQLSQRGLRDFRGIVGSYREAQDFRDSFRTSHQEMIIPNLSYVCFGTSPNQSYLGSLSDPTSLQKVLTHARGLP